MAARDTMRDERAFVVRIVERPIVEPLCDFVVARATVVGRVVVRAVTVVPVERVAAVARGATVAVVVRVATFFVALRGSGVGIALRTFVAFEREVVTVFDFWD